MAWAWVDVEEAGGRAAGVMGVTVAGGRHQSDIGLVLCIVIGVIVSVLDG